MSVKLSAEEELVVKRAVEMVDASGAVTYEWTHPDIKDIVDDLIKARVKRSLIETSNIYVRINGAGNPQTVSLGRIGATAPASPAPTVAPKVEPKKEPAKPAAPKAPGIPAFKKHTYVVPKFHADVVKALQDAAGLVICGVGPTGCGKTEHFRLLAAQLSMPLTLINCRKDMETAGFTGEKTVAPDPETKASVIKFLYGPIIHAMREGLDKDGNETGAPGLLVLDEFPTLPSWLGMTLNNLLEPGNGRRKLCLPENGGETITAHSGFRIVLLGNTIGRGTSMAQAEYTAQGDAMDISTLDRISVIFNYGYSRKAEENLLNEKIGDDRVVAKVLKFRDAVRAARKQQGLRTPLSTRLLVQLADDYRVFGGDIIKAFVYGTLNKLMPEERPVYSELFFQTFGQRIETVINDPDYDYDY